MRNVYVYISRQCIVFVVVFIALFVVHKHFGYITVVSTCNVYFCCVLFLFLPSWSRYFISIGERVCARMYIMHTILNGTINYILNFLGKTDRKMRIEYA